MAPNEPVTTRAWALLYASLGWRTFPVVAGEKRPLYRGWQQDATTDPDLISRWWRREPAPGIGLICGEAFVAFDIEVDHLPALRAWMRAQGFRLPETPTARTGRGGVHILVRPFSEGGRALRLDGVRIGELKGHGGFIVACPSRTRWSYGWLRSPRLVPLVDAPAWLSELVAPHAGYRCDGGGTGRPLALARGEARLAALARTVRDAVVGSRNDLLYWAMRRALEDGVPAAVASSVLARMATAAGLEQREIEATVSSAIEATA
jgi:hypothetical protein